MALRSTRAWFLLVTILILASAGAVHANDLHLEQALDLAREASFSLRRAELTRVRKDAALAAARAAQLPEITFRATTSYLSNPPEGLSIEPGDFGYIEDPTSTFPTSVPETAIELVPDPLNTFFQIQANMTWPIVTWGKLRDATRIAELDAESAALETVVSERELVREVTLAYHGLALARKSVEILGQMKAVYLDIVADRERAFDAGAVNLESVLDGRAQLAQIEAQLRGAERARQSAEVGLAYLLGTEENVLPVDPWRETVPAFDLDTLTGKARQSSTQLETIRLQAAQATILEEINRNSEPPRPDLALSIAVEASGQRIPLTSNWSEDWDVGFTVSLVADAVAWDWGDRAAATREAQAQARIAALGVEELAASLRAQIARLVEAAVSAEAQLHEKYAAQELAEEREKNARVSFENDLITREQYRGAQMLLLTNRLEVLAAGFAVEAALLDLEFLVGDQIR